VEQEPASGGTGRADQSSLLRSRQSLDRRLKLSRDRLSRAGELGKQPTRWIGARVSRSSTGDVLCVTRRNVKRDPRVDRLAAAQNQVHVPALGLRGPLAIRAMGSALPYCTVVSRRAVIPMSEPLPTEAV
jgi:hypothetical protein